MFGDVLEKLTAQDLRLSPGIARLRGTHPMLAASPPSNQAILDATKRFYGTNNKLVDLTAHNTRDVSGKRNFVSQMNGNTQSWQEKQMTPGGVSLSRNALFNDAGGDDGGLFGPTLDNVKASDLFSTVSVGVSVEAIAGIGGLGGLGCSWDIAKREGPKGYGYATLELGLKVAVDINLQASIFNLLPSQLNQDVFGLTVGAAAGFAATFGMFFTSKDSNLTVLGYSISIGVGLGGGAAVFGGHLWNF